ncbi:SHOCT domain-containing protein [Fervidobacterium riparium]|nr:hypothetical protein IB67_02095 [Fervidobacterium riparium]
MMRWWYGFPAFGAGCAGGWFGALWWLRPVISFGLFILAVYIIYRLFFAKGVFLRHKPEAIQILDERFARGEITEEDYRKMKSLLEENERR